MSEHGCYSPSFKKPSDVLRMRKKRARSDGVSLAHRPAADSPSSADIRPFSPGPLLGSRARTGAGAKRRNPFANIENTVNSPRKRVCTEQESDREEEKSMTGPCEQERTAERLGSFSERLFNAEKLGESLKKVD